MDLRGTQYHFVVGLRHIGMFKNKDIESPLGLSCFTVGKLWTNTELEMALRISLHSWKFIYVVANLRK